MTTFLWRRVDKIEGLVSLLNSKQILSPWLITMRHFSFNEIGGNKNEEGFDIRRRWEELCQARVLRGQKPINQPHSNSQEFNGNRGNADETGRDGGQSGDSFLDKFKFDFDDKIGIQSDVEASGQSEEARAVNSLHFNQPAQESMPQDVDAIFKKMKETGLIPNAVAMLDGLCKDGNFQEALKLFGLMREKGTIPDIVVYTAVVDGYTKAHKADDAIRIFRKMQSNGISPNAFSYTVLIQGLYKCSRLHDAVEFCVEMLEAGHSLNVTTFVGLVDGFCKENGIEEAKGVIKTLTGKGFAFDEKAVRVFLDKKTPFSPSIWEAIFGKAPQMPF